MQDSINLKLDYHFYCNLVGSNFVFFLIGMLCEFLFTQIGLKIHVLDWHLFNGLGLFFIGTLGLFISLFSFLILHKKLKKFNRTIQELCFFTPLLIVNYSLNFIPYNQGLTWIQTQWFHL
jgi:hypothetical protein